VPFPEDAQVDTAGWWEAELAKILIGFEAADRSRLEDLLKPLVNQEMDAHAAVLGKLATTQGL